LSHLVLFEVMNKITQIGQKI